MFSKLAASSLTPRRTWIKKVDPTEIAEPIHTSREASNDNSQNYSKRTNPKGTGIKKRVVAPPPSLFVDLSGDNFPSTTHTISTKPRVRSARYSSKKWQKLSQEDTIVVANSDHLPNGRQFLNQ